MNKKNIVKGVTKIVVGAGVGTIVTAIVKNNVTPSNPWQIVSVAAGTFVLSAIAADVATSYTDKQIDDIHDKIFPKQIESTETTV